MKSIMRIGLLLFMSLMVTGAFAQQRGQRQGMGNMDPDAQAKQQLEQLKKIVKIETKEEAKLSEIFLKSAKERQKKMTEMRDSGDREGMREAIQALNTKRDEELKKVLGEKRMKKYLEELEKIRQERGGQRRF
jgi:hypothetical protein